MIGNKIFCLKIIFMAVLFSSFSFAEDNNLLLDKAERLIETRHLSEINVSTSKDIVLKTLETDSDNLKANWLMSRIYSLLGDKTKTNDEKIKIYNNGVEYGKKAIKIDNKSPDAHFWYMVNIGRNAQLKGIFNAMGIVGECKKEMEIVLEINPKHIGAMDALAMYYYELPGLFGGSIEKSLGFLQKGLEIDPNDSLLYVDIAKVYRRMGKNKESLEYLKKVISMEKPTNEAQYILEDKPNAEKLLKEIEGK
ncbi:MAG: hypothetical protein A2452_11005 [Candidatus Firestonebacteria bacterium RIFOXYC2_FULL_39_67]|nr:MAG: hypothetical protein A2452_11005 [Candidatus Firestonebacteria bacterium RIFOXYC2_FULL_39_67]